MSSAKSVDAMAQRLGINRHISKKTEAYEIAQRPLLQDLVAHLRQKTDVERLFL